MRLGGTTRSRFLLFGGLYFAQGVPWGFLTVALPVQLAFRGLGPVEIGSIMSAAWLPWACKPLVGPLVDRVSFGRFGRRRPFVLLAEVGMAVTLFALMGVDPKHAAALFTTLVFVHNAFAATQDVATDALAIDLLPEHERGRATGIMSGCKYLGSFVGGPGALSWVGTQVSWPLAYTIAIVLLLVPALLALLASEPPAPTTPPRIGRELWRAFILRSSLFALGFALLCGASDNFLDAMSVPFYKDRLGLDPIRINTLKSVAWGAGVLGALVGGVLADRLGRRRALLVTSLLLAAAQGGFAVAAPLWSHFPFLVAYSVFGGITVGMLSSTEIALFMDLANPRAGATHFQLYMSALNLKSTGAEYLGGQAAIRVSPEGMFGMGALIEILPLPLLLFIDPGAVRRALGAGRDGAVASARTGAS